MDEISKQKIIQHQQKYQSFLKSMNCCPLCSTPLTLIHEVDTHLELIKETAHCSQCDIETRKKDHPRH
jgi:hypothetical protein